MHTCRNCNRAFSSALDLALHEDTCVEGELLCRECGSRFAERDATRDGWHYECPEDDCDGSGRGEDIVEVARARVRQQQS